MDYYTTDTLLGTLSVDTSTSSTSSTTSSTSTSSISTGTIVPWTTTDYWTWTVEPAAFSKEFLVELSKSLQQIQKDPSLSSLSPKTEWLVSSKKERIRRVSQCIVNKDIYLTVSRKKKIYLKGEKYGNF